MIGFKSRQNLLAASLTLLILLSNLQCIISDDVLVEIPEDQENKVDAKFALDPRLTKHLAQLEYSLQDFFVEKRNEVSTTPNLCYQKLSKYLSEFRKDDAVVTSFSDKNSNKAKAERIAENPLLTFRMIRRFYITLYTEVTENCLSRLDIMENLESAFAISGIPLLQQEDFDEALKAILRIQYIYGLNATSHLRKGILNGVKTGAKLNFEDCLALAKAALDFYKADILAYQWIMAAVEIKKEGSVLDEGIQADINLELAWEQLIKFTRLKEKSEVKEVLQGKMQETLGNIDNLDDQYYYATCRGEVLVPPKYMSMLYCYMDQREGTYFYLSPVKVELISFDPPIAQAYDIIGNKAINHLVQTALEEGMSRSPVVVSKGIEEFLSQRTSLSSWIFDENKNDGVLRGIDRKMEQLTDKRMVGKLASTLEVVMYGSLGHYAFHYDSIKDDGDKLNEPEDCMATFLMFLSDVKLGGLLAFPEIGVFVRPIKGSAVLWYNSKLSGRPDPRILHGGCPVLLGSKIVANKWIPQNENMFRQPCSLYPQL